MANYITDPNMGFLNPVPSVDPGPDYALNISNALATIGAHNHSSGKGVTITPSGLSINVDLPFLSNNATFLRSCRFVPQGSPLSLTPDIGCVYVSGVDLYYNDVVGNQIRITQSGSVSGSAGTITGLPSGTASAAYGSGTFVFQSKTNTSALLDCGSIILRNNTSGSYGLTLNPPSAMASNFSLVLPNIPIAKSIVTVDTSGNIVAGYTVDNSTIVVSSNVIMVGNQGITATQIANQTITATQIANQTITATQVANQTITPTQQAPGTIASNSNVGGSSASGSFYSIVNVTLTTTGRPVIIMINATWLAVNSGSTGVFRVVNNGTPIALSTNWNLPAGIEYGTSWCTIDQPAAGAQSYTFQGANSGSGATIAWAYVYLNVREL